VPVEATNPFGAEAAASSEKIIWEPFCRTTALTAPIVALAGFSVAGPKAVDDPKATYMPLLAGLAISRIAAAWLCAALALKTMRQPMAFPAGTANCLTRMNLSYADVRNGFY
jgi:hypothetical protein